MRLCYGAQRFSEDLDFAGGHDFKIAYLLEIKKCIEHYIGNRYELEVLVKEPNEVALLQEDSVLIITSYRPRFITLYRPFQHTFVSLNL